MKKLNNYIIEKLKISKDSGIIYEFKKDDAFLSVSLQPLAGNKDIAYFIIEEHPFTVISDNGNQIYYITDRGHRLKLNYFINSNNFHEINISKFTKAVFLPKAEAIELLKKFINPDLNKLDKKELYKYFDEKDKHIIDDNNVDLFFTEQEELEKCLDEFQTEHTDITEKLKIDKDVTVNKDYEDIITLIGFDSFAKKYINDIEKVIKKWMIKNNIIDYIIVAPKPVEGFPWDSVKFINKHLSDGWGYEYLGTYDECYLVEKGTTLFWKHIADCTMAIEANDTILYFACDKFRFSVVKKDKKISEKLVIDDEVDDDPHYLILPLGTGAYQYCDQHHHDENITIPGSFEIWFMDLPETKYMLKAYKNIEVYKITHKYNDFELLKDKFKSGELELRDFNQITEI